MSPLNDGVVLILQVQPVVASVRTCESLAGEYYPPNLSRTLAIPRNCSNVADGVAECLREADMLPKSENEYYKSYEGKRARHIKSSLRGVRDIRGRPAIRLGRIRGFHSDLSDTHQTGIKEEGC